MDEVRPPRPRRRCPAPRMAAPKVLKKMRKKVDALNRLIQEEEDWWNDDDGVMCAEYAVDHWLHASGQLMLMPLLDPAIEDMLLRDARPETPADAAADLVDAWLLKVLQREHDEVEHLAGSPEARAALVVRLLAYFIDQQASSDGAEVTLEMDADESFKRAATRVGDTAWNYVDFRIANWRARIAHGD